MTTYRKALDSTLAGPAAGWAALLDPAAKAAAMRAADLADAAVARGETILPAPEAVLRAPALTPPHAVKVVILGQDPYPTPGDADGLAFSTAPGRRIPKSLANIFRELRDDLGIAAPADGSLERWARQGVLLLNATLTVPAGRAGGHRGEGWEVFTRGIIRAVAARESPCVFVFWGNEARRQVEGLDLSRHGVITSAHPSPLSAYRGFFGSSPFSRTNALLREFGRKPVEWSPAPDPRP